MGEVIKFPGRGPEDKEPNETTEEDQEVGTGSAEVIGLPIRVDFSEASGDEDILQTLEEMGVRGIKQATDILDQIDLLIRTSGGVSKETLEMRRALVEELDPEAAMDQLLNSSEADWKQNPAYYKALAEKALSQFGI